MTPSATNAPGTVAGIILAAGAAERMGDLKQLLLHQGIALLQHVVNVAEASRLDQVVVVTGAHGDEVEASLRLERATTTRNRDFRRGNMSSLERGAKTAADADALILLMGDHPGMRVEVVDQMVALWIESRPWAGVTAYSDRLAHPFLLSRRALDEATALGGPKLLWRLLAEDDTGRVAHLPVEHPAPIDVNTPADYDRLTGG